MENFETPMTSGVATNIGTSSISNTESKVIETGEFESTSNSAVEVFEAPKVVDETEKTAEKVLESAKEGDFEATLEKLSDGEFEDDDFEITENAEGEAQVLEEKIGEDDGLQIEEGEQVEEVKEEVDPEKEALMSQIEELRGQVEDLQEKNADLSKRLQHSEEMVELSMQTMLEMLKLMQKLAEKEKDEEETNVLEIMIKMVTFFLQSIVEGDIAEGEKQGQKSKVKAQKNEEEPVNFEELVKKIQAKKAIQPQPTVEKQAA